MLSIRATAPLAHWSESERRSQFYTDFNSHTAIGTRGFTREYVVKPRQWQFNIQPAQSLVQGSRLGDPLLPLIRP